ncbi:MAG: hypothetical protein RL173_3121 [Fibrobacterota bacterium]|jgi:hypothetical protein
MTILRNFMIPALAAIGTGSAASGPEVTIYNQDLALIKDHRVIDLAKGRQEYAWEGVAQTMDATSASFGSPTAWALEQNYRFDLVSRGVLLSKYLGKEVQLVTETVAQDGKTLSTTTTGRILSVEGDRITALESNGKIVLDPPGRVVLPSLPQGLLVKPSLVLDLESPKAGKTEAELRYLCGGFSWKADYVAVLDSAGKALDLEGLVTLQNQSGASYTDARLKLVAGDVNRVRERAYNDYSDRVYALAEAAPSSMRAKSVAPPPQFKEQGLFEYHLYELQRPTTLLNKEQKQVNLLAAQDAKAVTRYVFDESLYQKYWWWSRDDDSRDGLKCAVQLDVANREENHLGVPLPKGKVRVYKQDKGGSLQFVGEDLIDHTPRGDTLHLSLGQAFELRGRRTVENSEQKGEQKTETVRVDLRNAKDQDVVVEVVERQAWPTWKVKESTAEFVKRDASTVVFKVKVPKRGEASVKYTYWASWK